MRMAHIVDVCGMHEMKRAATSVCEPPALDNGTEGVVLALNDPAVHGVPVRLHHGRDLLHRHPACMSLPTPDRCNGWLELMPRTAAAHGECNMNGPPAEAHGELELQSPNRAAWGRVFVCMRSTQNGTGQLNVYSSHRAMYIYIHIYIHIYM